MSFGKPQNYKNRAAKMRELPLYSQGRVPASRVRPVLTFMSLALIVVLLSLQTI
jgi:hypothetical protein